MFAARRSGARPGPRSVAPVREQPRTGPAPTPGRDAPRVALRTATSQRWSAIGSAAAVVGGLVVALICWVAFDVNPGAPKLVAPMIGGVVGVTIAAVLGTSPTGRGLRAGVAVADPRTVRRRSPARSILLEAAAFGAFVVAMLVLGLSPAPLAAACAMGLVISWTDLRTIRAWERTNASELLRVDARGRGRLLVLRATTFVAVPVPSPDPAGPAAATTESTRHPSRPQEG